MVNKYNKQRVADPYALSKEVSVVVDGNTYNGVVAEAENEDGMITVQFSTPQGETVMQFTREELDGAQGELSNGLSNGLSNTQQPASEVSQPQRVEIPKEGRGRSARPAYHLVPIERTLEELHNNELSPEEIGAFIDNNITEAQGELRRVETAAPKMGTNIAEYKAAKAEWQKKKDAVQAKLDYYAALKKREAEIERSELQEAADAPVEVAEGIATPDELVSTYLGGIKITPESFKRETGLGNAEQQKLVGYIASEDKGGVSVERAAEAIAENYGDELAGAGFKGDVQDIRDMIISVLADGNPKTYAKRGAEQRAKAEADARREEIASFIKQAYDMELDDYITYEENVLPRVIQDYTGFDEQEYYSILANEYQKESSYDTERESESTGRGGNILQAEQPVDATRVDSVGEGNEGGAVPSDVQGGSQNGANEQAQSVNSFDALPSEGDLGTANAVAQGEAEVTEPVGETGKLPASGEQVSLVDNQGNPIDDNGRLIVEEVAYIDDITDEDFENPTRNVRLPAVPENVATAIGTQGRPVVIKKNVFEKNGNTHVELEPEDSRNILRSALYNPNIVGSTQPIKRPDYKVAIKTGEQNAVVVLDVYRGKDVVEIVGWRMVNEKGLAKMQRQAEREGGQFLILSPNDGSAAALSALPLGLSSTSEDSAPVSISQENGQKSGENAQTAQSNAENRTISTENGPIVEEKSVEREQVGPFGRIYTQFKNKFEEAFDFLVKEGTGDATAVFERSDIGEIDLVWGDEKGGLRHIIEKHTGEGKSFSTYDDAKNSIADILKNGDVVFSNGDKIVIKKGHKLITLRKNVREKGKKTADKNWVLTAYDETKADGTSAISDTNKGQAAQPTDVSADKDNNTPDKKQITEQIAEDKKNLSVYANRDLKQLVKSIEDALPQLSYNAVHASEQDFEKADNELRKWQIRLAAAKELLEERDNGDWKSEFGVKLSYNKNLAIEDVKTLFDNLNEDKAVGELFDKVYKVAKRLGLKIKISDQLSTAMGSAGTDGIVKYAAALFYAPHTNQSRATTLLHELIHTTTMYATALHGVRNKGGVLTDMYNGLPQEIKDACAELERIYNLIKDNKEVAGEYGITSVNEMVAELANVDFRTKMKKIGLWERLVNAVKRLFDFPIKTDAEQRVSDALSEAERVLDTMLENFDKTSYNAIIEKLKAAGLGRKRRLSPFAELQQGSLTLDRESPEFERATNRTVEQAKSILPVEIAAPEQVQMVMGAEQQIIAEANERFNRELDAFKENRHKGLLHLGAPMGVLSAAGVNAKELTVSPTILHQHLKKHNLTTDELKGLAEAVQSPILVYRHGETRPHLVVVTEIEAQGGKLSVALRLDENGNVVEVSNVSSVHSKDAATEIERLSLLDSEKLKGYLRWVEKEKVSDWLGLPYEEERQDANPKLVSVAKVIEEFENPKVEPEIMRTSNGTVYGWAVNGKIYLTPDGLNPDTPVHEYTHLWASAVEKNNPELWARIVDGLKASPVWNEVLLDENYRDIWGNENRVASEVLSRLSGRENYNREMERAREEIKGAQNVIDAAEKISLRERVKRALSDFWDKVKSLVGLPVKGEPKSDVPSWMEFVEMPLKDFWKGVRPKQGETTAKSEDVSIPKIGLQKIDINCNPNLVQNDNKT
ncbi:MAG: hypothetical protein IJZ22_08215 [Bacteroidaceae bacterium]|nr:hypothetical protein [Bacteroidaceae bacterium]